MISWFVFCLVISIALYTDLCLFQKNKIDLKLASIKSVFYVILACLFAWYVGVFYGSDAAIDFITGYVVELSLSMDNVFVFILIFEYLNIPKLHQGRVLFYGILSAIILRFVMIISGVYIISKLEWVFYIFGAILIYSAYKMLFSHQDTQRSTGDNAIVNFLKRFVSVSKEIDGNKFLIKNKRTGKRSITPLLIALIMIEKTDIIFALDSIPAILAITKDVFIVTTSNIFAIVGLRSLYIVLASITGKLRYLRFGLAFILFFIGGKMILAIQGFHIGTYISLGVILTALIATIVLSLLVKSDKKA